MAGILDQPPGQSRGLLDRFWENMGFSGPSILDQMHEYSTLPAGDPKKLEIASNIVGGFAGATKAVPGLAKAPTVKDIPWLRHLPADEAHALAAQDAHVIPHPDGGFIGAPASIKTREDLGKMRTNYDRLVELGADEAHWYPEMRKDVATIAGPDPARQRYYAGAQSIYSPQRSPREAMALGNKANAQIQAGVPVRAGTTPQDTNLQGILASGEPAGGGMKTGIYNQGVDPTQELPITGANDMWQGRNIGASEDEIAGLSGNTGLHKFSDGEQLAAANRANQRALGGRTDWTGPQVQAASWVAARAEDYMKSGRAKTWPEAMTMSKRLLKDEWPDFAASIMHEDVLYPQAGHLAPGASYKPGGWSIFDTGHNRAATEMGLFAEPDVPATGFYAHDDIVESNPAAATRVQTGSVGPTGQRTIDPESAHLLDTISSGMAVTDVQGGVIWHRIERGNQKGLSTAAMIPLDRQATTTELKALNDVAAKADATVFDTGKGLVVTPTKWGEGTAKDMSELRKSGGLDAVVQKMTGRPSEQVGLSQTPYSQQVLEDQWKAHPGSGAVVDEMMRRIGDNPSMLKKLDSMPVWADRAKQNLETELAARKAGPKSQPYRKDIETLHRIMSENPKNPWSALFSARAAGVALPAGLLATLLPPELLMQASGGSPKGS